jgi:hypothetical protein
VNVVNLGGLARTLARELRTKHGALPPSALAELCGVEVRRARWHVATGRVFYFAECTRRPLCIVLNDAALELWEEDQATQVATFSEVVIAHELGHLLLPQPAAWDSRSAYEDAAHVFARELTGLAFHPARYEQLLRGQT